MSPNYEKLKAKLLELFMLDQPDLDFGIFRIMNSKRQEITRFLDNDLLPQVRQAFAQYRESDKAHIEAELQKAIAQAKALGVDPDSSTRVQELKARLAASVDLTALENEVYSDLYNFFRRYYKDGDFLSLRRYKEGVYALPYEGEEVKLYWANHDQYYIKTSEYFRDYAFTLPNGKRVHFKIVEVDVEKDNRKADANNERRFILAGQDPVVEEDGQLTIRFNYLPCDTKTSQKDLIDQAAKAVFAASGLDAWLGPLAGKVPTEKNPNRTLLEKHLMDYTARNTFDYFIHKDLGGFLRRELDFYIKNEIMHLDDIESEAAPKVEQYLSKIKVVRQIAHKIIRFLEQLENFQKKLWLKKKFVVETNYCLTLDRVPEALYPEIAANDAQREEWVRLFAINEIEATDGDLVDGGSPAYSEPLTIDFLKANPFLLLDTAFFGEPFKQQLLASFDSLHASLDGLLLHSDNFHALHLLQHTYRDHVRCIYIDPPYNTDASEILYKNNYRNSSWLSLVHDRLLLAKPFLTPDGTTCVTIDDEEFHNLWFDLDATFGRENALGTIVIRNNPQGRSTVKGFAVNHEYAIFYANSDALPSVGRLEHSTAQKNRYGERDDTGEQFLWENFRKTGTDSNRADRPKQFYPIYYNPQTNAVRIPNMTWDTRRQVWQVADEPSPDEVALLPLRSNGEEKVWKWGSDRVLSNPTDIKVEPVNGGGYQVFRKNYLNVKGSLPGTWWDKAKYAAGSHGTNLLTALFGVGHTFSFPKSVFAVEDCLRVSGLEGDATALDYFAGSGTTAHAIVNMNRRDGGSRKYVLVEMGKYFTEILKPRLLKAIYAVQWKNGRPQKLPEYIKALKKTAADLNKDVKQLKGLGTPDVYDFELQKIQGAIDQCQFEIAQAENLLQQHNSFFGLSHFFKYSRLESYEDCLNNLAFRRTSDQHDLLTATPEFRESYMLAYLLDTEAAGSASLLNIDAFEDPFNYKLNIASGSVGETRPVTVDLVETFNYLLGLRVRHIDTIRGYRVVVGHNPNDEKVLVIWRNTREKSNADLEDFFTRQQYNTLDMEFDLIYVNGDNNLENLKRDEDTWKVRLIEEEFQRLMFDVQDV